MEPQKKVLNNADTAYYSFAHKKFKEIERLRLSTNLPIIKKTYVIEDTIILITSSKSYNSIVMYGSLTDVILLSHNNIYGFNYGSNGPFKLSSNKTEYVDDLNALYNKKFQIGDKYLLNGGKSWNQKELGCGTFLGSDTTYEVSLSSDGGSLFLCKDYSFKHIGSGEFLLTPSFNGNRDNLFLVSAKNGVSWNNFKETTVYTVTPNNGHAVEQYYWVPSFFIVDKQDPYGIKPGWYYGKYPNPMFDEDGRLETASVTLLGFLKTYTDNLNNVDGWCEVVNSWSSVNEKRGDSLKTIYFYKGRPENGNSYTYFERSGFYFSDGHVTGGSSLTGGNLLCEISVVNQPKSVEWWGHEGYQNTDGIFSVPIDHNGIIIIDYSNIAYLYRHFGGPQLIGKYENYIDHSISTDGTIVAIFCGEENVITEIHAYDLFGTRSKSSSGEITYSRGSYTVLADASFENLSSEAFLYGAIFPKRDKLFKEKGLDLDTINVNSAFYKDGLYDSALSTLEFEIKGRGGITVSKLMTEDGITADFGSKYYECFKPNRVVVDDPDSEDNDKLVFQWKDKGVIRGKIRGNFSGYSFSPEFHGIGTGASPRYGDNHDGIIELPEDFTVELHNDNTLGFSGYSGELTKGSCIDQNDKGEDIPSQDCYYSLRCTGGTFSCKATSSCGQTGEREIEVDAPEELIITLTSPTVSLGSDFYHVNGGVKPYIYELSCGDIDSETGEVTDISGCCGTVILKVTDDCGVAASIPVRGPNGQWNVIEADCVPEGETCGSQHVEAGTYPNAYCDMYQCYCTTDRNTYPDNNGTYGDGWYYIGATLRYEVCRRPAWLGNEALTCSDGRISTCWKSLLEWQCP